MVIKNHEPFVVQYYRAIYYRIPSDGHAHDSMHVDSRLPIFLIVTQFLVLYCQFYVHVSCVSNVDQQCMWTNSI